MKKIELGQIFSVLANIGVIASLIFVGIQVQQGAAATRSATVLQLKDSWVQLNLATATSPELADAFHELKAQKWNDASYQTRFHVAGFFRTLFHTWSNAYYQYRNGTLEQEWWVASLREARENMKNPVARQVWSDWSYVYDDSFRSLMDDLIADVDKETSNVAQ
jgi:hypothetical protein